MTAVTAIAFAFMWLSPCLCSTAMAAEMEGEPSGCCPHSQDSQSESDQDSPEHPDKDQGCCVDCDAVCAQGGNVDLGDGDASMMHSEREELDELAFDSWSAPQLLATLWLVDRLAEYELPQPEVVDPPPLAEFDQKKTYLQIETLLI